MKVHLVLLIILLLLNIIPEKTVDRKKIILPFSFILVLIYWAIRYDYGLDYWNYYNAFYSKVFDDNHYIKERLFYLFFYSFKAYYKFVIVESVITAVTLFYFVRKYIPTTYYCLFFLLLFAVPGLHFNLISTMRSDMAAFVLFWAYEFFYISKKRWVLFIVSVLVAVQFHNSAMSFIIVPIVYWAFNKMKGNAIMVAMLVCDFLSVFITQTIFDLIVSQGGNLFSDYEIYSEFNVNTNFYGFVMKSVILLPSYYMCKIYDRFKNNNIYRSVFILAFLFTIVNLLGLDLNGRFTVYLYPFFIIALSITSVHSNKSERWIILMPYLLSVVYALVSFYSSMMAGLNGRYSVGNPCFYSTIFDAPSFP